MINENLLNFEKEMKNKREYMRQYKKERYE